MCEDCDVALLLFHTSEPFTQPRAYEGEMMREIVLLIFIVCKNIINSFERDSTKIFAPKTFYSMWSYCLKATSILGGLTLSFVCVFHFYCLPKTI
jgi:hypothetical protein